MHKTALGNYAAAITDYTKSIGINNHLFTYNQRAEARYEAGDYEEAVSDYSEVLKTYSMDFSLWVARAEARVKSGDKKGACEDLHKALELGGGKDVEKLIRKNCRKAASAAPVNQEDDDVFHCLIKEAFYVKNDSAYLLSQLTEQPIELMIMRTGSDTLIISIHDANDNVYFLGKAVRYEDTDFKGLTKDPELYEWDFLTHLLDDVNKAIVVRENVAGIDKNKEVTHRFYIYFNDDSYMLIYGTKFEL